MTQNQIAYFNARELQRHNAAAEEETQRHQKVQEALQKRSNELAHESNIISKEHYERMDSINATHYANQDAYNTAYLAELQRSNVAGEAIRQQQNAINAAGVSETARHQMAMESIDARLANNTIYRTEKEMSLISPQASLIQGQVATEKQRAGLLQEQKYGEQQKWWNTYYSNKYTQEQIKTEPSRRFLNMSSGYRNVMDIITSGVGTAMRVMGSAGVSVR